MSGELAAGAGEVGAVAFMPGEHRLDPERWHNRERKNQKQHENNDNHGNNALVFRPIDGEFYRIIPARRHFSSFSSCRKGH
jgi:hypothetical protein